MPDLLRLLPCSFKQYYQENQRIISALVDAAAKLSDSLRNKLIGWLDFLRLPEEIVQTENPEYFTVNVMNGAITGTPLVSEDKLSLTFEFADDFFRPETAATPTSFNFYLVDNRTGNQAYLSAQLYATSQQITTFMNTKVAIPLGTTGGNLFGGFFRAGKRSSGNG